MSTATDSSTKRVLIYRLGSLGDTVVALPSLYLIARAYPNAERRLLTNIPVSSKAPAASSVLTGTGLVDGYFNYKTGTRSLRELSSIWLEMVRWRPQVLVYLAAPRGVKAAVRDWIFFSLCGIRRQIGVPLTKAMRQNRWIEEEQTLESEAGRLLRNIAKLGNGAIDEPTNWDIRLTENETAKAQEALAGAKGAPLIAVSLGTKVPANDWGAENWRSLLAALAVTLPGYALATCGSIEDFAACEAAAQGWRTAAPDTGAVVNLCGRLAPRESAAVFAQAKIFIGHDSGPMHLAAAVQTPCVAIFAARNRPGIWFPQGRQHRVIYHPVDCLGCGLQTCVVQKKKCIASITVGEVTAAVQTILGRN